MKINVKKRINFKDLKRDTININFYRENVFAKSLIEVFIHIEVIKKKFN